MSIIKKNYVKFGNYSFSFKRTFSNPIFSSLQSKTLENVSQKLIKFNKTTIQMFLKKKKKNSHQNQTFCPKYVKHIKYDVVKPNIY